jgi:hypothetical protein
MSRVRVVKSKLGVSIFPGRGIISYRDAAIKEISTACKIFNLLIRKNGRVVLSHPSPLLRDREIIRTRLSTVRLIRPLESPSHTSKSWKARINAVNEKAESENGIKTARILKKIFRFACFSRETHFKVSKVFF